MSDISLICFRCCAAYNIVWYWILSHHGQMAHSRVTPVVSICCDLMWFEINWFYPHSSWIFHCHSSNSINAHQFRWKPSPKWYGQLDHMNTIRFVIEPKKQICACSVRHSLCENCQAYISMMESRLHHQISWVATIFLKWPGGRLNKKDGLTRYGNSHVKDKTS